MSDDTALRLPPGFSRVAPYFFVDDADAFVAFLKDGLGGSESGCTRRPDGKVANARIRFGDASVMVSEASEGFPAMCASYYFYVADADAAMARAIAAGATSILDVQDMPYGDRQGGVRDRWGNLWWLSQRLVDGDYEDD